MARMRAGMKKKRKKRRAHPKRKVCRFCADSLLVIDYKNVSLLEQFVTERGKIVPRRISGTCAKHQRRLSLAIKQARNIAMMPYMVLGE